MKSSTERYEAFAAIGLILIVMVTAIFAGSYALKETRITAVEAAALAKPKLENFDREIRASAAKGGTRAEVKFCSEETFAYYISKGFCVAGPPNQDYLYWPPECIISWGSSCVKTK